MQRENWIDWAKALGILLVVMGHSVYASKDVTSFIFVIHMPLFFFVSGYLFKTSRSWYEISISNVKTLLIPYIILVSTLSASSIILQSVLLKCAFRVG